MTWRDDAACTEYDPEFWCEPTTNQERDYAISICKTCPVRAECLADTPVWDIYTIRGGLTPLQRTELKRGK